MTNYAPIQTDPFPVKTKIKSRIWKMVNRTFFRYSPYFARKYRVGLVRLFGGQIHWSCSLNRLSKIDHPWNLKMGEKSSISEYSWVYCLDKIEIGANCCISKDVYLLSGSHNINSSNFDLITKPIFIGDGVWLAVRSVVLPGITIGSYSVVASSSVVIKDVEENSIIGGNPAKIIKYRKIIYHD